MSDYVPLMTGDKVVGKIKIDTVSGKLEGELDPKLADILHQGLIEQFYNVAFYGRAAFGADVNAVQERFHDYLKEHH